MKVKATVLADTLEKLAAHYRSLGDAEVEEWHVLDYLVSKEDFVAAVALMPHPLAKKYRGEYLDVVYSAPGITLINYATRDRVCTLVEPAKPAVYSCEPLLSVAEEASIGGAQ